MPADVRTPPPLPHEHGAWVMLVLPMILGAAQGGWRARASWLVAASGGLAFLAHYALVAVAQRRVARKLVLPEWARRRLVWGSAYLVAALAAFAAAVIMTPAPSRRALVGTALAAALAGGVFAVAVAFGRGRDVPLELVGMIGTSLAAPMMALAAGRTPHGGWITAPALAFAYCASSLAWVRAWDRLGRERRAAIAACAAAHVALAGLLIALAVGGWMLAWGLVAFVPVVARTVWGLVQPPASLRAVGLREIWVASVFTALSAAALLLG